MATAYSDEVAVGSYNRIRLRVEYSGTSASCHIEFRRTSTYTTTWGDDAAQITFNGQTVDAPYWYTGTVDSTWREIDSASGFTVPLSGGTFTWVFNNPLSASVLGCSGTITIGSQTSPPTGLSVSLVEKYTDGAKFNVSVSSYGNPSSASGRYIEAAILGTSSYGAPYKFSTASNTSSSSITVKNSGSGSLTIQPNTRYYYGAYANNTQQSTNKVQSQFVTLAPSPTVTVGSVSGNSATINYSTVADGGVYDKTIQYSTDGGTTWQTGATVTGGSAQSGSFTIDNLPSGENAVQIRTNTTSGADSPITVTITIQGDVKLYGSVGELTSLTGTIRSGGSGNISAFDGATFLAKMKSTSQTKGFEIADGQYGELDYLRVYVTGGPYYSIQFHTKNNKSRYNGYGMGASGLAGWGITAIDVSSASGGDYIDLTTNYTYKSEKVEKLYGPMQIITDINPSIVSTTPAFIESVDKSVLLAKMQSQAGLMDKIASGRKAATLQFSCHSLNDVWGGLVGFYDTKNTLMFSETIPSGSNSYQDLKDWAYGWGIVLVATPPATTGQQRIYLYGTYSNRTKRIRKLYGSVNGVTALCYADDES